jgi:hypothetical protein
VITGYQAERAVKAYARIRRLGIWHIAGVPNADSVGDLVTISEEGMKKQLSDKIGSANDEAALAGYRTNTKGQR